MIFSKNKGSAPSPKIRELDIPLQLVRWHPQEPRARAGYRLEIPPATYGRQGCGNIHGTRLRDPTYSPREPSVGISLQPTPEKSRCCGHRAAQTTQAISGNSLLHARVENPSPSSPVKPVNPGRETNLRHRPIVCNPFPTL